MTAPIFRVFVEALFENNCFIPVFMSILQKPELDDCLQLARRQTRSDIHRDAGSPRPAPRHLCGSVASGLEHHQVKEAPWPLLKFFDKESTELR